MYKAREAPSPRISTLKKGNDFAYINFWCEKYIGGEVKKVNDLSDVANIEYRGG